MEDEISSDVGVVEDVAVRVTKAGKKYVLYRIGGDFVNDFTGSDKNLKVGERIKYSYSISGSEGQFKNLLLVEKLPAGVVGVSSRLNTEDCKVGVSESSYTPPAFYGMTLNNAVKWSLKLDMAITDEEFLARVEKKFNLLWTLAERLKKEKGVN